MAVAFKYVQSPTSGEFRQGEILGNVIEYKPVNPVDCRANGTSVEVEPIEHAYVIIITQDCDLLTDYNRRCEGKLDHQGILQHLLLCDMFKEEEIRSRIAPGRDIWTRVKGNQDERYHCLAAASIGDAICEDCAPVPAIHELPAFYLDFKRVISLPTTDLYRASEIGETRRIALLPAHHLHDLIHRLYTFLSRIGLPV